MTKGNEPASLLRAIGAVVLRGITAVGGLLVYAVVLLLLAVVGGRFDAGFTAFNVLVLVGSAVWALMPLFRYVLGRMPSPDAPTEDNAE